MPEVKKSPTFAAFSSFLIWGLGQMYSALTNLKIGIGILLLIMWVLYWVITPFFISIYVTLAIFLAISIPIAVDAFRDARAYNLQIKIKESERKNVGNFCPFCGREIESAYRFCPNCGKKLT